MNAGWRRGECGDAWLIAWVLMRTIRRLPLGAFFSVSLALIVVFAIAIAGKGMGCL